MHFIVADIFQNQLFFKTSFSDTIKVSTSLNPDQAQSSVGPYLAPNCLQMLVAVGTSRQRDRCRLMIRDFNWASTREKTCLRGLRTTKAKTSLCAFAQTDQHF